MKLSVGQKLWYVPNRNRGGQCEVTVTKVGRLWANLDNRERISLESLEADAGQYSSPGRAYLSKGDYELSLRLHEVWREFRRRVDHQYLPPDGVTFSDVERATDLLFGARLAHPTSVRIPEGN